MKTIYEIFGIKKDDKGACEPVKRIEDMDCSSRLERHFKAQSKKDYLGMDIKEYKDHKDKLRNDIENLVREFNRDVNTMVVSIDIDIGLTQQFGENNPFMSRINCKITTEIDQ